MPLGRLPMGIAGTLLARQVGVTAGQAGLVGLVAGTAFNFLLRRSPVGAIALGGAMLAHKAYKSGQEAKAKRDAKLALEKGIAAPVPLKPITPLPATPL
ncbi:MAG: hypothetical protein ABW184_13825 [Sphingobium sp.]